MKEIPVEKNAENELPIPSVWRPVFVEIVNAIVKKDYHLKDGVKGVAKVSADTATQMKDYIDDYGEELMPLPPQTWNSSVYMWYGNHWEVLIDLWTVGEGHSDLTLRADVREKDGAYVIEIRLVYVL